MTDVSLIVCTRNRARNLTKALDSIARAAAAAPTVSTELVIVDNASEDETADVASRWIASNPGPLSARLVSEPRRGVSKARNAGLNAAHGEVLVFTDDDCELDLNYIPNLQRHFAGDRGPVMRGGRVELGDPSDLPFTIKVDKEPARLTDTIHPGGFIACCNMALSREVVDRIGGFDERFGQGGRFMQAEDTDFVMRAYHAGIPVEYVPDMVVYHFHGRKDLSEIKKLHWTYQVGNGALYAKHFLANPKLLKHIYWDIRDAFKEPFGGKIFDPELGLTHWSKVRANVIGMALFCSSALSSGPRASHGA